jgi:selenocysteine lyase/cysteine desulfurase
MNKDIRDLFPATDQYTYLNSAAVSPMPTTAIVAINKQLADVSANGSENYQDWVDTKNRARASRPGCSMSARTDRVHAKYLGRFATIANGLSWQSGDNIVSFEREFPANFTHGGGSG